MLDSRVTTIKGVGEALEEKLNQLHIYTVRDLIYTFPSRYDHHQILPLSELIHEQKATIQGTIVADSLVSFFGKKKSRLTFPLQVGDVIVKVIMFNRHFLKTQLQAGKTVTVTGKWDQYRQQLTAEHHFLGEKGPDEPIEPVYLLKQVVPSKRFKKLIKQALEQVEGQLDEFLPDTYMTKYKLISLAYALKQMHFPESFKHLKQAKRRLVYDELLLFQLKLQAIKKFNRERTTGVKKQPDFELVQQFIHALPFTLTDAQMKAMKQIQADLTSPYRMHRLLQGDVGSGKTIVAAIGIYLTHTAGSQSALMVPTEILAEQHYQGFCQLFKDTLHIELLTGSVKGKKRREILAGLASGEVDVVIGTHALIQAEVDFDSLGFVVIDEQHRFGVNQRKVLREKGMDPDVLFMTATPIPRTLAITSFGDMDVSIIDEMPVGRKPVETFWVKDTMLDRILAFIEKEVNKGHQAYIVTPLIEGSDKMDIQNAVDLYQQLAVYYDSRVLIGLLHGRMTNDEKDAVMKEFTEGKRDVLVSTTVIEVGVNVPNATVMVIYDAERFGLSQLHQLRGRVGRSDTQSYCILIADPKGDVGKERMRVMTETTNGFELAEYDLKLRGPGDFFGKKQSGLPEFRLADLVEDYRTLETARRDATDIIYGDLLDNDLDYAPLKQHVETILKQYQQGFD
ncbi:ATP-dependent DNA helicase RecG [Halolactibacillus miurensis]|uniref:ATP-dependent DNA helicase RecG n=1 Tax=Halolactibacillus miurensis TaxID=306541 RepID=A0A1I6QCS8_9BACI|nr:ATP-dependent DNA helicase RecG [Halolactibacillus miurensis]GEM03469.1 ATP-dependent DNA helicase RecG [Halolactibacillus miurensis]SFS50108.1 ATP-dependent DNA helicase RecG [Halolactibacillus miurensis]